MKHYTPVLAPKPSLAAYYQEDKVGYFFGKMTLTYVLKNGDVCDFDWSQELAKGIASNLKKPCYGVQKHYVAIFFSYSSTYSTLDNMVDGFDMNKLFIRQQAAPTTVLATTRRDASLAAISTAMTNCKNISSKNVAHSADNDNDKEETIDCKDMSTNVKIVRDVILSTIQSILLPSNVW